MKKTDMARIAAQLGSPEEVFVRAYVDDENLAFRGWLLTEAEGDLSMVNTRTRARIWLTTEGMFAIAFRDGSQDDPEMAHFEGEYLFAGICNEGEVEGWIDDHRTGEPSDDQKATVRRAWQTAQKKVRQLLGN